VPTPDPEHALRRLIDDLAVFRSEDISTILESLEPAERAAVDRLLKQHAGYSESLTPFLESAEYDPSQFSPWLVERLHADNSKVFAITPATRETLRACAARLHPLSRQRPPRQRERTFRRRAP
jgi:hypothetical protein